MRDAWYAFELKELKEQRAAIIYLNNKLIK